MSWESIIIPILTFCVGFIISEVVRRINRAEMINVKIFDKRLEVYHELSAIINRTYHAKTEFCDALRNGESDSESVAERHNDAVLTLMSYFDDNALFISEELGIHCMTTFISTPSEFSDIEEYESNLRDDYKSIKQIIQTESGMKMLNKNMKRMMKYKHKSEYISYYQHAIKQKKR